MKELIKRLTDEGYGLGGSRNMAAKYPDKIKIGDDTDWDFYCENTKERRKFLEDNGFRMIKAVDRSYWDDLLVDMYKHSEWPIEVLIRKDREIYRRAVDAMSAEVFMERLWKSSPLRNPDQSKDAFCMGVRQYFNGMFRLHGYNGFDLPADDELPF